MGVIGLTQDANNTASQGVNPRKLICRLQPTTNCLGCSGFVYFEELRSSARVTAQISGLVNNTVHGIHIHQFGDISDPTGASLGPHLNPTGSLHGLPPTIQRHLGDMGNVQSFDDNGIAWYQYDNKMFRSTAQLVGHGVVLHQDLDHGSGQNCDTATGSAGSRFATCVIGVAEDDIVVPVPTVTINNKFVNVPCPPSQ